MTVREATTVPRWILVTGLVLLLLPIAFLGWWCITYRCNFFTGIIMQNYEIFFVLPYGAVFAYFLVVTLESSRGKIEVEFGGLKFKGAAAPIVFWILIFLALILAMKAFWQQLPPTEFKCAPATVEKHPEWVGP
ncbi:hypothetical protein ACG04R_23245 [Roseateles sp. BYS78W]|uniref:Uncharacterized protein n=1 Tax=Pelomonas candidula TaxID=3299025 RepID=A0ABW7HI89_9BURK